MAGNKGKVMAAEALGALWVGVTAMLAITIYLAISNKTGCFFAPWILFMAFPPAFIFGTSWKHCIPQIVNIISGFFIGGVLSSVVTGFFMPIAPLWAIGIGACICTFLLQFLFQGPLGKEGLFKGALGYTAWAFIGMIVYFATAQNAQFQMGTVLIDLVLCILLSAFVVWGCILMAKLCKVIPPADTDAPQE